MLDKIRDNKVIISKGILFVILIFIIGAKYDSSLDIYFMLNHGRYILQNGFTNIDPFTIHEGLAFQFEKWLTCIVSWLVYDKLGIFGLNIIMLILTLIIYFLVFKISKYVSKKDNFIIPFITCCLFLLFVQKRPSLISNICLLLEFYYLERFCREDDIKNLYILPLLAMIIMNTHSTMFPVFYMVATPFLFSDMEITSRLEINQKISFNKTRKIFLFIFISFLASLINPFTYKSYIYMYKSYTCGLGPYVLELRQITVSHWTFFLIIIPVIFILVKLLKNTIIVPVRYLVLLSIFMLFALYAVRNYQYYILFSGIILMYFCENKKFSFATYFLFACILWTIFMVFAFAYSNKIYNYNLFNGLDDNLHIIDNIQTKGNERIFAGDEGSYFEFKELKPYQDTRMELFFKKVNHKKDILPEYNTIIRGYYSIEELQDKYNFDMYYVHKDWALHRLLANSDFIKVAETDEVAMFSKEAPKDYLYIGKYNGNVYDVDLTDAANSQQVVDDENSCARAYLKNGTILLADHGHQYFSETQNQDKLCLWDNKGNLTVYKKVDTKRSNAGEWITEDGTNIFEDYISEIVTQVCDKDKLEWNFWEKEN